jgi:hypothetical protein
MPRHQVLTYDGVGYWRGPSGVAIPGSVSTGTLYRPTRITPSGGTVTVAQLQAAGIQGLTGVTNSQLVMWPGANPDAAFFDDIVKTMADTEILILPEATRPDGTPWKYQIDSAPGFRRAANINYYYSMSRYKKGVIGLGPNVLLDTSVSSFTAPAQPKPVANGGTGFFDPVDGVEKVGCQHKILETTVTKSIFANLCMVGRSFGGIAYSAVAMSKGGGIMQNVYMKGASRGFQNSPNGESGGVSIRSGSSETGDRSGTLINCEIDSRDATGARVGTSPFMFNNNVGVTAIDVYAHHARAGMPTCWSVDGPINYTRVRSEYNGSSGSGQNGHSMNFELCTGVAEVNDCDLICNYLANTNPNEASNTGMHIGGGSDVARLLLNVRNTRIDKGPRALNPNGTAVLACQLFGYVPQQGIDMHYYDADGTELPSFIYGG